MTNLRIVVDVNILISALLFPHSKPDLALQKAQDLDRNLVLNLLYD